jgi:hypothetical protein
MGQKKKVHPSSSNFYCTSPEKNDFDLQPFFFLSFFLNTRRMKRRR